MNPESKDANDKGARPFGSGDADRFIIAIFPTKQYLEDASVRGAVIQLAKDQTGQDRALKDAVQSFHPVTLEDLKKRPDLDAYGVLGMYGSLIRTHIVTHNGVASTNPHPDNWICDSCHSRRWLRLDYQDSKLDGANIPVWLCPACTRLKPEERDVRF